MGPANYGEQKQELKHGSGEEYQVLGNDIRPCQGPPLHMLIVHGPVKSVKGTVHIIWRKLIWKIFLLFYHVENTIMCLRSFF